MIDARAEATAGAPLDDDGWACRGTVLSLLVISTSYLVWCAASALIAPFALAHRRRRSDSTPESWPSGDAL